MSTKQNQFYTSISKHYSEIFPYKAMQLKFVESSLSELDSKQILDIGCATGELAYHLAAKGGRVTGIDLNKDLLLQARNKNKHQNNNFQVGNMLELKENFDESVFDAILCFGNTVVHLLSEEQIGTMFDGVHRCLKPGGLFMMQILNYDHIYNNRVEELPLIETDQIRFERRYAYEDNNRIIRFQTDLYLKKDGEVVSNETKLLALGSKELTSLLTKSGFLNIELFANFKKDTFGGSHFPLVLKCEVM